MKRNLDNINKRVWTHQYWCNVKKENVTENLCLETFTRPASKAFDKRRSAKQRLKKKIRTEAFISRKMEAANYVRGKNPVKVNINLPSTEDEILSEVLETDDMYFPKIEIYLDSYILVVPIFNESKTYQLEYKSQGKHGSYSFASGNWSQPETSEGSGFIIVYYSNEDLIRRLQLKGRQ